MPTRGALSVVASVGTLAEAFASGLISNPSTALFHTSAFAAVITYGTLPASALVRLTLAPPFRRRFTTIAESAPLYGKRHEFAAVLVAASTYLGVASSLSNDNDSASGVFANSVFTPN